MARRDIIVIGASAGGLEALLALVSGLPADLPAAVFIALHVHPDGTGVLPDVLGSRTPLPVAHAADGDPIEPGRIYVAPPNRHLRLGPGHVHVTLGPRENGFRPAIDPLFRSAAAAYGPRVVGVVLSGLLDDGSGGLVTIKRRGGLCVVQDPADALCPDMPKNALQSAEIDHTAPASALSALLASLARGEDTAVHQTTDEPQSLEPSPLADEPTALICPACGGALAEHDQGPTVNFECHLGHAYAPQSLLAGYAEELEVALWTALRLLKERASLCERTARRLGESAAHSQRRLLEEAALARKRAGLLERVIQSERLLDSLGMRPDDPADPAEEPGAGA